MTEAPAPRTLMLGAAVCDGDEAMSGTVGLRIGGEVFTLRVTVPAANVPLAAVLPVLQGLADVVVADAVADKAAAGNPVRCGMRCSACCNQPVPITASEARGLAATVAALPADRRRTIEARFAAARAAAAPLRARVGIIAPANAVEFGIAYFALGITCPFLEDRMCSICAARPLIRREHIVTSPPVECETPGTGRVVGVDLPAHAVRAVREVDARSSRAG